TYRVRRQFKGVLERRGACPAGGAGASKTTRQGPDETPQIISCPQAAGDRVGRRRTDDSVGPVRHSLQERGRIIGGALKEARRQGGVDDDAGGRGGGRSGSKAVRHRQVAGVSDLCRDAVIRRPSRGARRYGI